MNLSKDLSVDKKLFSGERSSKENMEILDEKSSKIEDILDINIKLKDHQLAIIKRCYEIEDINICKMGIMSDKPGTGKTFAILGLIYTSIKKPNIIIVPQNIIVQWCNAINQFSNGKIKYKKITEYSELLNLYDNNYSSTLSDYDILITTSLYYNMLATTMKSNNINVERVFFDEIDSISSFLINEINANFIWFVSASFNYYEMGIYKNKIDEHLLPYITCECENSFIDHCMGLPSQNIYKIICRNIYLDNIFEGMVSSEEYKVLNAMDYSRLKKKFCNRIAQNEKEALDFLVKDKLEIIEIETIRIEDLTKQIDILNNNSNNSSTNLNNNFNEKRINILNKQLDKSKQSLEDSNTKLNLIRERLKENNYCPLCYNDFVNGKKLLSNCCKNVICYECTNNWFNNMKKESCIWCNLKDIKFEDYVMLKEESNNLCRICDKEFITNDDKYYATCCKKDVCKECIKDWYHKMLKDKCLICSKEEIVYDDFMNEKEHEDMKLNEKSGIKYTRKTKMEFMEYFIRTKIYAECKVILCSSYIRIFNDIKKLLNSYNIKYKELDDGNIYSISNSINEYNYGNINVLLMNSNLFGCGLNLQCTTDIVFLHKTESELEKQIIGRAQRLGRKDKLNIWHLMHQNENIIYRKKNKIDDFDINFFSNNSMNILEQNIDSGILNNNINNNHINNINNINNNHINNINNNHINNINNIDNIDNIEYYDSQFDNYMNIE